jgi:SAM-dependent methyltransferase
VRAWTERAARRFARLATRAVVARPALWRAFRRPLRAQFDRLAPSWEARRSPAPVATALAHVDGSPRRILDLGTGTGIAARVAAERYAEAEVVGVDLAPAMVEEARRLLPDGLARRLRFEVADAAALPYPDGNFDLVLLVNMIPFFEELARVTARDGQLLFVWTSGPETPIYVPTATLRERLRPLGFTRLDEFAAVEGTGVIATR